MANPENKQIPYESTQKDIRDAIESVATAIGGITHPDAEDIVYDNSVSGLSATDVQNALDEIVSDIPTVNNGTLTIQQNGTSIGSFSANTASDVTANIKTPTADKKTATSEFDTANGGLLEECVIDLVPVQDLHGYPNPWVGGAGKNKLQNNLSSGTSQNVNYTVDNNGIISIEKNQTVANTALITLNNGFALADGTYRLNGCPSGGGNSSYVLRIYDYTNSSVIATDTGSGSAFTVSGGNGIGKVELRLASGYSFANDIQIKPMIRLSTESDATFEPYSNICPISGHTEVDLDVKDGDNVTQHTYQVQIGSTVYGGTVDLVSGVMNCIYGYADVLSSDIIGEYLDTANNQYLAKITPTNVKVPSSADANPNMISNCLKAVSQNYLYDNVGNYVCIVSNGAIRFTFENCTTLADMQTWITNHPLQVCYELATPFIIQLTPQQIEALVGQNNLSTPLDGQSIDSVEYREVFAFDDVEKVVSLRVPISMLGTDESGRTTASQSYASGDYFYKDGYMCKALTSISAGATLTLNTNYEYSTLDEILKSKVDKSDIYANAGSHNSIYRGKYLGSSVTASQWTAIQNGTFDDLFIGDYWTINGVNWRIAHFDYWLNTGDTNCTDHHVVIVPDTNLYSAKMNSTDTTEGGYYNSEMRGGDNYLVSGSSNLYSASETIKSAFGSSHILTHRELLTNAISSGNASGWAWYDSSVDLMSEVMVYGTLAWSVSGKGYEIGIDKEQLALFKHDISKATNRVSCCLRGIASAVTFANILYNGGAYPNEASASRGVRPCFAIK